MQGFLYYNVVLVSPCLLGYMSWRHQLVQEARSLAVWHLIDGLALRMTNTYRQAAGLSTSLGGTKHPSMMSSRRCDTSSPSSSIVLSSCSTPSRYDNFYIPECVLMHKKPIHAGMCSRQIGIPGCILRRVLTCKVAASIAWAFSSLHRQVTVCQCWLLFHACMYTDKCCLL